ncbi:MAG TPA: calcium/proton exchanger [Thermoanaerobaculia bacterium]|jgi:Ca2+:H+ antiporter|nr:calcium/proton exchanger [Thermoanaerobaculia bacterium]
MKRIAQWVLYATIPVSIALQFMDTGLVLQFVMSCIAVLPLAAWIGVSTEQLAHRMGPTYGALFNATFGNFAEMVIAILAIRAGLPDVVRASLSGSILGNLLFVAGLSMLFGGWKRETQKFNALAAESQAGQLILAAAAMLVPALFFRSAVQAHHPELIHQVSIGTAVILIISYACGLWFSFRTHKERLSATAAEHAAPDEVWSMKRAIGLLLFSSVLMGVVAEGLVHAVGQAGAAWGLNQVFLGFIVLAVVGNAAEHSTAVMLAMRNQMDTALNISMQSSVQIALFVTPLLVFLSYPLGHPLDILFTPFELLAVGLGVAIFAYLVMDGETNWYEGIQLLAVYAIIAVALYFLPGEGAPAPAH